MSRETAFQERLRSLAHQCFGLSPREVQHRAAGLLEGRTIVEMDTGEGKTLTVAMAAIAIACRGQRVFVATANDYLATRDAAEMAPLFDGFGSNAGALTTTMDRDSRRRVYSCGIVYGTIRELGFDKLRDALAARHPSGDDGPMVPKFDSLVVDEADNVLIDEALTPLVISERVGSVSPSQTALYRWSAEQAKRLAPGTDFVEHTPTGRIALTENGIIQAMGCPMPPSMGELRMPEILHSLERSLEVATRFLRDVHYLVKDDQVLLVDEYSGRLAAAKKMSGGLHQAIEAKEGLPITPAARTAARMTIQELVNQTPHLCGVTATAQEDKTEFRSVYGLHVKRLPPHFPSQRKRLPSQFFANRQDKEWGIVLDVRKMIEAGRAVLIGTRTIEQSESLSSLLTEQRVAHVVLNARQSSEEASIIAQAGQRGRVTVATNMAGRGTDIRIADAVRTAGGLHVIVSEPHTAARIDRQLAGRCGRQGDPGTVSHFFSADDKVIEWASGRVTAGNAPLAIDNPFAQAKLLWQAKRAQARLGRVHRGMRFRLAQAEQQSAGDLRELGLDPHLDRVSASDE